MYRQVSKTDTQLLHGLKVANRDDADELISRYFARIVRASEKRFKGRRVHATGPDDVAASVVESLWRRASEKRFADDQLNDRDELWRLLSTMVSYKVADHLRRESAQKRGGGVLQGESALYRPGKEEPRRMDELPHPDSNALEVAAFQEEHRRLMALLDDEVLREIAVMRLEGYKVSEIGKTFQRSSRWVKRKLAIIRGLWKEEFASLDS